MITYPISKEYLLGTHPNDEDTDNEGLSDFNETNNKYPSNPRNVDTDEDDLNDFVEFKLDTNPKLQDTDRDGQLDLMMKNPLKPMVRVN